MKGFTAGILTGGAMLLGAAYFISDTKIGKKAMRKSKQLASKAEHMVDDMVDDMAEF